MSQAFAAANLSPAAQTYLRAVSAGRRAKAPVRVRLEAAAVLYDAARFEAAELVYRSVLESRPHSYRVLSAGDKQIVVGWVKG